jgi:hypothetical protein
MAMSIRLPIKPLQHDPIVIEPSLRVNCGWRKAYGDLKQEDEEE